MEEKCVYIIKKNWKKEREMISDDKKKKLHEWQLTVESS